MKDYKSYELSKKEFLEFYLLSSLALFFIGMLFYNNINISIVLACFSPFFEKTYSNYLLKKQINNMRLEFKDFLYSVSASLSAGRKFPIAFEESLESLGMFYGSEKDLYKELYEINKKYKEANVPIEKQLVDFGQRTGIKDIVLFSKSCLICKNTGGNLESVCLKSAYIIIEKLDFNKEVETILSEKKFDIYLLIVLPLGILFLLSIGSYQYIEILYTSSKGKLLMTLALALMIIAIFWSLKIMKLNL